MIFTKEQQENILQKYIKENHNIDECSGFIDGINATIELINKLTTHVVSDNEVITKPKLIAKSQKSEVSVCCNNCINIGTGTDTYPCNDCLSNINFKAN